MDSMSENVNKCRILLNDALNLLLTIQDEFKEDSVKAWGEEDLEDFNTKLDSVYQAVNEAFDFIS